jgi:dTDP-4-dehydrorhamnose reductase
MRILVTGSTGQAGLALGRELAQEAGLILAGRDRIDLSKPEALTGQLDSIRPDLIVNAAAYTAVDQAEKEAELAYTVNAIAPATLGEWACRYAVPLIHFSTDYVFDGRASDPYCETHPVNPLSVYGTSKAEGERLLLETGAPCLIIRTAWVYSSSGRNFLKTIARLARERDELTVVNDQEGTPTSSSQIAAFVHWLIQAGPAGCLELFEKSSRLVHFTASGWTSWHGFATAIVAGMRERGVPVKAMNIRAIPSSEYPTPAVRPKFSRLSLTKLNHVFGYCPDAWEQALTGVLNEMFGLKV